MLNNKDGNYIAFFGLPGSGHLYPSFALVEEFIKKGISVRYFCDPISKEEVLLTGAEFESLKIEDDVNTTGQATSGLKKRYFQLVRIIREELPDVLILLNADPPTIIVTDFLCTWGFIAGKELGIPVISFHPTFIMPPEIFPSLSAKVGLMLGGFKNVRQHFTYQRHFNSFIRILGIKHDLKISSIPDLFTLLGEVRIVTIPERFQYKTEKIKSKDNILFIGSCLYQNRKHNANKIVVPTDRKVIYISLGTVFNNRPEFYSECVSSLRDSPYYVIMSVGENTGIDAFQDKPDNFYIASSVSQIDVLKCADVFVSHAGMNSVIESIHEKVPIIAIPQAADQFLVARQIRKMSIGLAVFTKKINGEKLLRLIQQVLANQETYKQNLENLANEMAQSGGAARAVDYIATRYAL